MSARSLDFNRHLALERIGGDEALLLEIVELFLVEHPQLMRQAQQALEDGNAALLERAAHTLKGSLSTIGAEVAAEAALQLEMAARSGQVDRLAPRLVELRHAMDRLLGELQGTRRS